MKGRRARRRGRKEEEKSPSHVGIGMVHTPDLNLLPPPPLGSFHDAAFIARRRWSLGV
jgi:hypothetical protein